MKKAQEIQRLWTVVKITRLVDGLVDDILAATKQIEGGARVEAQEVDRMHLRCLCPPHSPQKQRRQQYPWRCMGIVQGGCHGYHAVFSPYGDANKLNNIVTALLSSKGSVTCHMPKESQAEESW
jgi:hypothetical protein